MTGPEALTIHAHHLPDRGFLSHRYSADAVPPAGAVRRSARSRHRERQAGTHVERPRRSVGESDTPRGPGSPQSAVESDPYGARVGTGDPVAHGIDGALR